MEISEKLEILSDSAKYDVACTSSGSSRKGKAGGIGNTVPGGICHAFSSDGRCISLLKVLMSNRCINDCKYCGCRSSLDRPRAAFTPEELADLTISFYKRNYIEGLFLSSAIIKSPDYTTELMCRAIDILRNKYGFNGYIHAKGIPGTSPELITKLGVLIDRMSVNIELPSETSLKTLAPQKTKKNILTPMSQIRNSIDRGKYELARYRHAEKFAPAGQSTQMIIGASPESDRQILKLSEGLYDIYKLKRVFYSAYIPVGDERFLPSTGASLLREHRLYQADWLLRFYGFAADEILNEDAPSLDIYLDPKCNWALNNLQHFPVDVNTADYEMILRVPGIGITSAKRIIAARKSATLDFDSLKKIGVVLKRARFFITCGSNTMQKIKNNRDFIYRSMIGDYDKSARQALEYEQLSLFESDTELKSLQTLPEKEVLLLEA